MENDFLEEMGYPGLTGRLKRLSDLFVYQTKEFYKAHEVDIEPNWHMIFVMLEKHENLTVMEIAETLHLSHPAIVKLINKMKKKGYIKSVLDPTDNRKYQLTLSKKAKSKLPELKEYWNAGEKALEEMLDYNTELLQQLSVVEKNMNKSDFRERMEKLLKK
ncbi:MarR family transcriptional regulator [Flavobacteriaceae bacterium KMM 6898]|nr:MarR family transcriptional regulator [Flavobacteriaceae bacterium KMM 6898]